MDVILQVYFFQIILRVDILSTPFEIGLGWMPQSCIDDESILVQVMS